MLTPVPSSVRLWAKGRWGVYGGEQGAVFVRPKPRGCEVKVAVSENGPYAREAFPTGARGRFVQAGKRRLLVPQEDFCPDGGSGRLDGRLGKVFARREAVGEMVPPRRGRFLPDEHVADRQPPISVSDEAGLRGTYPRAREGALRQGGG